ASHRPLRLFPTRRSSDLTRSAISAKPLQRRLRLFSPPAPSPSLLARRPRPPQRLTPFPLRSEAGCLKDRRCCTTPTGSKRARARSEEHTSELQSLTNIVC